MWLPKHASNRPTHVGWRLKSRDCKVLSFKPQRTEFIQPWTIQHRWDFQRYDFDGKIYSEGSLLPVDARLSIIESNTQRQPHLTWISLHHLESHSILLSPRGLVVFECLCPEVTGSFLTNDPGDPEEIDHTRITAHSSDRCRTDFLVLRSERRLLNSVQERE